MSSTFFYPEISKHNHQWLKFPRLAIAQGNISSKLRYKRIKPQLEFAVALALLVLLSPLIAAVAVVVKVSSPGAIIFKQRRLTKGSQTFLLYKFRTMTNASSNSSFTEESDARVTRVGKVLRKYRLDELPQLVNVLLGEMSLIGPRPERPEIAEHLSSEIAGFERRLAVKAGISGLSQVSNGYASTLEGFREKLDFDLQYIERQSFLLDTVIAVRTIGVVLSGFGAR